jgi:hypothetical protein
LCEGTLTLTFAFFIEETHKTYQDAQACQQITNELQVWS